eukprot:CAMPEP_0171677866 /NCGR_PEP_ID=MMETSP0990-20121206/55324_1 /TAXON_ID=483369 /ORGANISM="non described non described, Strain CCMP2098" /LENGTH=105 /DNA_ID=CAMNT_0012264397 /DNA_START=326 /DNA_END=639 /DNA_ORIENTATION=-
MSSTVAADAVADEYTATTGRWNLQLGGFFFGALMGRMRPPGAVLPVHVPSPLGKLPSRLGSCPAAPVLLLPSPPLAPSSSSSSSRGPLGRDRVHVASARSSKSSA